MHKIILLYGFACSGKSTLAHRYINDHPLDLCIEGDILITMLGNWSSHEETAREYVFRFTLELTAAHLRHQKNVIIPYTLTDAAQIAAFEDLAQVHEAQLVEVYLSLPKQDAVTRLLQRGTWGEAGLPPLSEQDLPEITALYDTMDSAMQKRQNILRIDQSTANITSSYQQLLDILEKQAN